MEFESVSSEYHYFKNYYNIYIVMKRKGTNELYYCKLSINEDL